MKKVLFNSLLILTATLPIGCNKQETTTEDPEPLEGCHDYVGQLYIKVGTQSETVSDGSIEVCFDDGSFSLEGGFDLGIEVSFDEGYSGKGTYTFSTLTDVTAIGTNENLDEYEWGSGLSGSVTITENTVEKISGSYEFQGQDWDDNKKTVKGTFSMQK